MTITYVGWRKLKNAFLNSSIWWVRRGNEPLMRCVCTFEQYILRTSRVHVVRSIKHQVRILETVGTRTTVHVADVLGPGQGGRDGMSTRNRGLRTYTHM